LARRLRRRYEGMPDAPHGISRVMATGRSEVMTEAPDWVLLSLARDADHLEMMRDLRPRSIMTVPLVARGRTLGAITFISNGASRYGQQDLEFAEEIARRAALAVDNARLFLDAKQAEERLRHQLDFTSAITGSLAEGVCAIDRSGRVVFANPAAEKILGRAKDDLIGHPLHALVHQHPEGRACPLATAALDGSVLRIDQDAFARADGGRVPVSYAVSPIQSDGAITGAVLAFHDATERLRAQAELDASRRQLAQSEKLSALGTLVSGVAHELRTPLTYLTNNLFLLQARLDAAARADARFAPVVAEARGFSQAMLDGVDRINALVKDLRPFANVEGGSRVHASLNEVVAAAVDLFRATHRGRVEVVAQLSGTAPLWVDRGGLQRVVINLLVNAADAMPRGGRVFVTTREADGCAVLEVQDEGTGIPPEVEGRIFDPFFTTKAEGTGLGLAITRRIVQSHGGDISFVTRLGRGTTFTVCLPLAKAEAPAARPLPTTTP
ncbi:MAG TPA: ATP-binding protein, partial [Candidatus Thermoplasmatota archaeon]|nr:ATP-binding protein [Candidatus Thermoplasmatota archaeon]